MSAMTSTVRLTVPCPSAPTTVGNLRTGDWTKLSLSLWSSFSFSYLSQAYDLDGQFFIHVIGISQLYVSITPVGNELEMYYNKISLMLNIYHKLNICPCFSTGREVILGHFLLLAIMFRGRCSVEEGAAKCLCNQGFVGDDCSLDDQVGFKHYYVLR